MSRLPMSLAKKFSSSLARGFGAVFSYMEQEWVCYTERQPMAVLEELCLQGLWPPSTIKAATKRSAEALASWLKAALQLTFFEIGT